MKNNQTATITSIDHLNKIFEVKVTNCPTALEAVDSSNVLLPLPKDKLSNYFEVDDEIEFKKRGQPEVVNLSCKVMRLSRFKRNLNSILRRLNNDDHSQKRCVLLHKSGLVLLSAKKNTDKVRLITEATLITETNHEKL